MRKVSKIALLLVVRESRRESAKTGEVVSNVS